MTAADPTGAVAGPARVDAVTFDFFNTLVFHTEGRGRGRVLTEYVRSSGRTPGPWEHRILYRIFERHADAWASDLDPASRFRYLTGLAQRAFAELGTPITAEEAAQHAEPLWEVLGPGAFSPFPEAPATLDELRSRGLGLAVISNWQRGLESFLTELGLRAHFDHVLGSDDVGLAKPDPRIFERASALLGVPASRVLHVGDTIDEDYRGAASAGFRVVLLERSSEGHAHALRTIRSLDQVLTLPEVVDRPKEG